MTYYVYTDKFGQVEVTQDSADVPVNADIELITEDIKEAGDKLRELRG
jgi:hypothetical protein